MTKPSPAKRPTRPRPAAGEPSLPFLRFYHSPELRAETLRVLDAIEGAGDPTAHRKALAAVVGKLTESGLEYYFMQPLVTAHAGFVVEQSARLGLAGANRVLGPILGSVIGRLDGAQLVAVCGHIRHLMR